MLKILTIVGARPQFIKAAAISRKISEKFNNSISEVLVHTGQHYDYTMSEVFFNEMGIPKPDFNLAIGSASHGKQTGKMISAIETVILNEKPSGVIVYGDTNSTLAGALATSKLHIPLIHIEAGLRSYNKSMPEEINRIVADHCSTLLFSPTEAGIRNLQKEGFDNNTKEPYTIDNPGIFKTGDIMYDNTLYFLSRIQRSSELIKKIPAQTEDYILATIHRPVNTDNKERLNNIFSGILKSVSELNTSIVIPLHPRTEKILRSMNNLAHKLIPENGIHLIPPVSFMEMIELEKGARVIVTDSGGVQKEAWFMKKPVVVLRSESEWVEIIDSGNGSLADASPEAIYANIIRYFKDPPLYFPEIYGNGNAAGEILDVVTSSNWL